MKLLILFAALSLTTLSCNNNSDQSKVYEDSAKYYSDLLQAATDSGYSGNDSIDQMRKTRKQLYTIMRQHYIDKMNESK